jgi:hypothetical protein
MSFDVMARTINDRDGNVHNRRAACERHMRRSRVEDHTCGQAAAKIQSKHGSPVLVAVTEYEVCVATAVGVPVIAPVVVSNLIEAATVSLQSESRQALQNTVCLRESRGQRRSNGV